MSSLGKENMVALQFWRTFRNRLESYPGAIVLPCGHFMATANYPMAYEEEHFEEYTYQSWLTRYMQHFDRETFGQLTSKWNIFVAAKNPPIL